MAGRARKRWIGAVCAAAAVVMGCTAVAVVLGAADSHTPTVALAEAVDGLVAVPGFTARIGSASTIVDGSLFVFGGSDPEQQAFHNDAVLVAPDLSSATRLPDAPFEPPLYAAQALAVGREVVVIGVLCRIDQRYDEDGADLPCAPGTKAAGVLDTEDGNERWRRVEVPVPMRGSRPSNARPLGATSDGRAIFLIGSEARDSVWAFEPGTDRWTEVEGPGIRIDAACMSGDTLMLQSARYTRNDVILEDDPAWHMRPGEVISGYLGDGFVLPTISSRDLTTDAPWVTSPPAADIVFPQGGPVLTCMDDGAFIHRGVTPAVGLAYSLRSRSWTDPPPPPAADTSFNSQVWTGSELVFIGYSPSGPFPAVAYDPTTNTWRVLDGMPRTSHAVFRSGDAIVGHKQAEREVATGEPGPAGVFRYVLPPR